MSNLEIELPANGSSAKLAIDGQDIARNVGSFTLTHRPGHTQLAIDVPVYDVTRINMSSVEVMLPKPIAALLERSGWTPPPRTASVLPRRGDGCPCEWLNSGPDPAHPEPILGMVVPTCPVHGVKACICGSTVHQVPGATELNPDGDCPMHGEIATLKAQIRRALDACDQMMAGTLSPSYIVAVVREALGWCYEHDPIECGCELTAKDAYPNSTKADYGTALTRRLADGTVVVDRADPVIGITRELLEQLGEDSLRREDGRIQLDSAGRCVYTFYRDDASPQGFKHDVLVYQRVHLNSCNRRPLNCIECECWCHGADVRRCSLCGGIWPSHALNCEAVNRG